MTAVMIFLVYVTVMGAVLTVCAAVADLLTARARRKARDQARAEDRAKRREERELFGY